MSDAATDIRLLSQLKRGDTKALKSLFDTYYLPLCRFVSLYLENKHEVEEVVMDLFIYLWEHRETLLIESSIKAYLFQAARNRTYNVLRNKQVIVSFDQLANEPATTMEMTLEIEELHLLLREAVMTLPDRCREVFFRSRQQHQSNREIADSLSISIKTVEAQIAKALRRIKQHLELNNPD